MAEVRILTIFPMILALSRAVQLPFQNYSIISRHFFGICEVEQDRGPSVVVQFSMSVPVI